jgi:Flp pilus assembly protein TadB
VSTEPPYPGPGVPIVTYTLREVLDQMNTKLDILPQLLSSQASQGEELQKQDKRIAVIESEIEDIHSRQAADAGVDLYKKKFWAVVIGGATVMGMVAGLTFQLITLIT